MKFSFLHSALLAPALLFGSTLQAENAVLNAGFESGMDEWQIPPKVDADRISIDKNARSGSASLKLETIPPKESESTEYLADNNAATSRSQASLRVIHLYQLVPVEQGTTYSFKIWYRTENLLKPDKGAPSKGSSNFLAFLTWMQDPEHGVMGDEGKIIPGIQLIRVVENRPTWREFAFKPGGNGPLVAPTGATLAKITFRLESNASDLTSIAWVDDVTMEAAPENP